MEVTKYDSASSIKSVEDVETFFNYLVKDLRLNFHPDDSFDNYINIETNEPSFKVEECALYDRLMDESFAVCEREGADIYGIGLPMLQEAIFGD